MGEVAELEAQEGSGEFVFADYWGCGWGWRGGERGLNGGGHCGLLGLKVNGDVWCGCHEAVVARL